MRRRHGLDEDLAARIAELTGVAHRGALSKVPAFRRIVVATNGSQASDHAVDWACRIAKALASNVHLVSVGHGRNVGTPRVDQSLAFEGGVDDPQQVLQGAIQRCAALGISASAQALTGTPSHEILRAGEAAGAELLLVGAGHEGKVEFTGMGSIAHQLSATVPYSILAVRGPPAPGPVVCGVDGSQPSQVAARVAVGVAHLLVSPLVVVHVHQADGPLRLPPNSRDKPWAHEPMVTFESMSGSAAESLVSRAKEARASLLVLGGRGLSSTPGWSLGSTTDKASARGDCNVLVVKA